MRYKYNWLLTDLINIDSQLKIFDVDGSGQIDFVEFIMSIYAFRGDNPLKQLEFGNLFFFNII